MLRLAIVDGVRREPFPGGRGNCPTCQGNVIAKCGRIKIHHWAHESTDDCDNWSESIGPWHLAWQDLVMPEFVEVTIGPHRADILGDDDVVIELQHSPIRPDDVEGRETFYGQMVWLFDATHRFSAVRSGDRVFFSFGRTKHIESCKKPILLDFGDYLVQVEALTNELSQFSGFGLLRDRSWFTRTYLARRQRGGPIPSPVKSEGASSSWPAKQPWKTTRFPSRWRRDGQERFLPKGTLYIPLSYEWVNRRDNRRWPVWSGVISKHPEVANGWTEAEFKEMQQFLKGEPMILDGHLRLMPSPLDQINIAASTASVRALLKRAAHHIDAGRLAILKDETCAALLKKAEEYEASAFGPRRGPPKQVSRADSRSLFD